MGSNLFSFVFTLSTVIIASTACLNQSNASFFSKDESLFSGACGYGSLAMGLNEGRIAAAPPSIYKQGSGCGACFQIRCEDERICNEEGTTVLVSDQNGDDNGNDFVLSKRALVAMAKKGMGPTILKLGHVPVTYKRVACQYNGKNLGIRVEESSTKPNYLAIKFLYQGGETEIVAVDVAQVGMPNWNFMSRSKYGAIWETNRVPNGGLQFRFVVTAGFDGKWYWAKNVLPSNWKPGTIYDMGLQITDVARQPDPSPPCPTI